MSGYFATDEADGSVRLWYPDGDELCKLHDNLGLDIFAKDLAPVILAALNEIPDSPL